MMFRSIIIAIAVTSLSIIVASCRWNIHPHSQHALYGINNSSIDVYFVIEEQYYDYLSYYPGTTMDSFFNLFGLAPRNGGVQRIVAGDLVSWNQVFKSDTFNVLVVADSIVSKYGWEEVFASGKVSAEYIVPVSYLDSTFKYVFFPPVEIMKGYIRMLPTYEELIHNYGITN